MNIRPNLFQASMLRWRGLHPYCAGHAIEIALPLDRTWLEQSIRGVLAEYGLAGLELERSGRYRFRGGTPALQLSVLPAAGDGFDVAAQFMESALNEPFPPEGQFDPLRFAAIEAEGSFVLALVYDHFIAGGDSIVVLMTDLAQRYLDGPQGAVALPRMVADPGGYAKLFAAHPGAFARGLAALPGLMGGWRRAIRPRLEDVTDGRNGVAHFRIDAEGFARLRKAARDLGVTQNDLWLALTLRAVLPIALRRSHGRRRTDVALASIVNVRRDFQPPATELFGQFLSSFRVVHPVAGDAALPVLARSIALQSRRAKENKLYFMTLLAMAFAAMLWPFASPRRRARLYIKYHPVFAGLTPLNVDALRRGGRGREADYLRTASTGPMAPMVLSITTSGAALRVGITYRTTALGRDDVHAVIRSLIADIESLPP